MIIEEIDNTSDLIEVKFKSDSFADILKLMNLVSFTEISEDEISKKTELYFTKKIPAIWLDDIHSLDDATIFFIGNAPIYEFSILFRILDVSEFPEYVMPIYHYFNNLADQFEGASVFCGEEDAELEYTQIFNRRQLSVSTLKMLEYHKIK